MKAQDEDNTKYYYATGELAASASRSFIHSLFYKTNRKQRSIRCEDVSIWNSLPKEIKILPKRAFLSKFKIFNRKFNGNFKSVITILWLFSAMISKSFPNLLQLRKGSAGSKPDRPTCSSPSPN